jgi:4-aminobutyrate aminotransferase-like enzyme
VSEVESCAPLCRATAHRTSGRTELAIAVVKRFLAEGILLLADSPMSNVLSFAPPFAISDEEIAFVGEKLQRALASG